MDNSPFAKLPALVLKRIARFSLHHDFALIICAQPEKDQNRAQQRRQTWRNNLNAQPLPKHGLALTQTCRELRKATQKVFYSSNSFHLYLPGPHYSAHQSPLTAQDAQEFNRIFSVASSGILRQIQVLQPCPISLRIDCTEITRYGSTHGERLWAARVLCRLIKQFDCWRMIQSGCQDISIILDLAFILRNPQPDFVEAKLDNEYVSLRRVLRAYSETHGERDDRVFPRAFFKEWCAAALVPRPSFTPI